jgi:hypothetical protein
MVINSFKKQCAQSIKRFENKVLPLDYIKNGILLWEGFAFCALLDLFNIDMIIESGIAGGRSTEIFARYFNGRIIAIDNADYYGLDRFNATKSRLARYKNVTCLNADSIFVMPKLISQNPDKSIALFLDGPKGLKAMRLAQRCFAFPNVKFVGIHDQCKESYHQLDRWDKTFFYTDSHWFIARYSYLDHQSADSSLQKELADNPNGPGVGFAVNSKVPAKNGLLLKTNYQILKTQALIDHQIAHAGALLRRFSKIA